jgi:hypothetical protein
METFLDDFLVVLLIEDTFLTFEFILQLNEFASPLFLSFFLGLSFGGFDDGIKLLITILILP